MTLFQSQAHQLNDNKIKVSISTIACKLINKSTFLHATEEDETEEWETKAPNSLWRLTPLKDRSKQKTNITKGNNKKYQHENTKYA